MELFFKLLSSMQLLIIAMQTAVKVCRMLCSVNGTHLNELKMMCIHYTVIKSQSYANGIMKY